MTRIICFDTETTGFEYAKGDRIIEIAAVELIDGKLTENRFHEYANPEGKIIPPSSYNVHKISNAFLEDKPPFSQIAQKFLDFVGDSPIVAHNGFDFDFPFLNYELQKLGLNPIPREQQMDSIVIARHKVFGPKEYTLDALAKWFGVSLATRAESHGALIDAEILAKVYLELEGAAGVKSIADIVAEMHEQFLTTPKDATWFPKRTFAPSETETSAHSQFISERIKKTIWKI
jgi:DNA polymerase-3 subunit epsilon